jgi:hypothetical protein
LAFAQFQDIWVVGGAFRAAVPAIVVVGAVFVVFSIGFVVFFVKADEIVECETVVTGDEVDARVGKPAAPGVQVAGAR